MLKNAGLFAPADLLTHGILSEVYVCALVVRCVLWVGDRTWYCTQRRELALLCMHRKVWTSSLSFRRVSRGKEEERVWSLLLLWSVHWWLLAELLINWMNLFCRAFVSVVQYAFEPYCKNDRKILPSCCLLRAGAHGRVDRVRTRPTFRFFFFFFFCLSRLTALPGV